MLFVAVDDHARVAYTAIKPDEKQEQAVAFLKQVSAAGINRPVGVGIYRPVWRLP